MKVKNITDDLELHRNEQGLNLTFEKKEILTGFTEVGTLINDLIPVYYKDSNEFKYFDVKTKKVYLLKGVNWVSGFHYVGSDLNYFNHNYRSDPIANLVDDYIFSIESLELEEKLKRFEKIKITRKENEKFDYDIQKKIVSDIEKLEYKVPKDVFIELLNLIKFYRIVGVGKLNKGLDMGSNPIKLENGLIYNKILYFLSKRNSKYGVMDIRTNEWIVNPEYLKINVFNGIILHSNEKDDFSTKF